MNFSLTIYNECCMLPAEVGKINIDGLTLLNQPRVTVHLAHGQDEGRRQGAYAQEDGPNMTDGSKSQQIQGGRQQGHVASSWFKQSSRNFRRKYLAPHNQPVNELFIWKVSRKVCALIRIFFIRKNSSSPRKGKVCSTLL